MDVATNAIDVGATAMPALAAGLSAAASQSIVHNWTIEIGNGYYGLMQFEGSPCVICFGFHILTLPFSAPVAAGGLLLMLVLRLLAGWYIIGNRRHRDTPGDA